MWSHQSCSADGDISHGHVSRTPNAGSTVGNMTPGSARPKLRKEKGSSLAAAKAEARIMPGLWPLGKATAPVLNAWLQAPLSVVPLPKVSKQGQDQQQVKEVPWSIYVDFSWKEISAYDILNSFVSLENSPLLDLINMRYLEGRMPKAWKKNVIIPVPTSSYGYRPVSLTT